MGIIDKIYIQKFHESKIEKYGSGNAQSLGWFSKESQLKKFDILTEIGDLNNSSVLDIGCGNGDLCDYLNKKYTGVNYTGIDFIKNFLDNAIEQNKQHANTKFYRGDFMSGELPTADYIFACGSLNYKNSDPDFVFKAIVRLYQYCKIGFGFNLLNETTNQEGILTGYSTEIITNYCKTLSPFIELKTGYEDGDFTVLVWKS